MTEGTSVPTTVPTSRYAESLDTLHSIEQDRDMSARLHLDHAIKGDTVMADVFRQSYIDESDRVRVYRADVVRPMGDEILAAAR